MKWYTNNPVRFEMEKHLLGRHHPGVKIIIKDGRTQVLKQLKTHQDTYLIEGEFPNNFPYSPMKVYIRNPVLKGSPPHQYNGDLLCLHGPNDVGPETTAKVYLDWAIQWIRTYERWLNGEVWPPKNISRL